MKAEARKARGGKGDTRRRSIHAPVVKHREGHEPSFLVQAYSTLQNTNVPHPEIGRRGKERHKQR